MKRYRVTVDGHQYDVEIDDPRARPVVARIAGEIFLVEIDEAPQSIVVSHQSPVDRLQSHSRSGEPSAGNSPGAIDGASSATGQRVLRAPMPGTIVAVAANAGRSVQRGDELVTIEAMKMFNVIRSPWAGVIAEVHVKEGRRIKQAEPLVTMVVT